MSRWEPMPDGYYSVWKARVLDTAQSYWYYGLPRCSVEELTPEQCWRIIKVLGNYNPHNRNWIYVDFFLLNSNEQYCILSNASKWTKIPDELVLRIHTILQLRK